MKRSNVETLCDVKTLCGFVRSEPDPDHSMVHCPCGSTFTWSGYDDGLDPWVREHEDHLPMTPEARSRLETRSVAECADVQIHRNTGCFRSTCRFSPSRAELERGPLITAVWVSGFQGLIEAWHAAGGSEKQRAVERSMLKMFPQTETALHKELEDQNDKAPFSSWRVERTAEGGGGYRATGPVRDSREEAEADVPKSQMAAWSICLAADGVVWACGPVRRRLSEAERDLLPLGKEATS